MMTMKEACEYKVQSRHKRSKEHRLKILDQHGVDGFIEGFTERELRKVKVKQKDSFGKGRKPAYNRIWRHYDLPMITKTT